MQPKLHNLAIVMTDHNQNQAVASLTIPEPSARRVFDRLAGIAHNAGQNVKALLRDAMAEIDEVTVNPPAPRPELPEGKPLCAVYEDDLIAIANGEKVVVLYDGEPTIIFAEDAAAIDAGEKHLYRDLETGEFSIRDGDGKAQDLDPGRPVPHHGSGPDDLPALPPDHPPPTENLEEGSTGETNPAGT